MLYKSDEIRIAVIGLGYVGLPLAFEFCKHFPVTGYDLSITRINQLKLGYDNNSEIPKDKFLESKNLNFTYSKKDIKNSNVYIIAVPTPVDKNNNPDIEPLSSASKLVGSVLLKGELVVFESTVFPGCTEEICVPILEKKSGLTYNEEFFCGYSPERINPGDSYHNIANITKVTSGSNEDSAEFVDRLYKNIITAGTFRASSIAVAEAAKVIENTQRDVNIALVNELAMIFNKLDLDTKEVLAAAGTKWNFLPFKPGLVGGHCIGVDPYYLTHKAIEVGYQPEMILAGRRINDNMGYFITDITIGELASQNISPLGAEITILGITFKENCPDLRNSKVITIYNKLRQYNSHVEIVDSWADPEEVKKEWNIELKKLGEIENQDAIIIAVEHDQFNNFNEDNWNKLLKPNGVVIDVKSVYDKDIFNGKNIKYWNL